MSTATATKPKARKRKAKVINCYLCLDEKVCHICKGVGSLHQWDPIRQAYNPHSGLRICPRCNGNKLCPRCGKKG